MATKEELVEKAKAKFRKEQLIQAAKEKWAADNATPANGRGIDQFETGARSLLEGGTLGLSEPVISAMNAAGNVAQDYILDMPVKRDFSEYYDKDVNRRRGLKSENVKSDIAGQLSGAILPAFVSGGTTAAAQTISAPGRAATAIGNVVTKGAKMIPGAEAVLASKGLVGSAARVVEGGAKAALAGTAAEGFRQEVENLSGHIKDEEVRPLLDIAQDSALFGAGISGTGELLKQGVRGLKGAARVFTGVKGEDIDKYLARPDAIRNAKTIEEIKDEVDNTISKLADDVDNAKLTKEQAKDAFRQAEAKVDDLVRENKNILGNQKADLRAQLRESKSRLDDAFRQKTTEVKTARLPIKADDVLDSVEQVKKQVGELSEESYKILDLHKGRFPINGVSPQISKIQNELKVGGELLSADAETAFKVLDQWKSKIKNISGATDKKGLSGGEVKRIIQELDSDIRKFGDKMAGEFSDKTYNALMNVRRVLDQKIKTQVPGYAQVMEETAKMNVLRGELSKLFGKRESAVSKLSRIDAPNMERERQLLKELGVLSGKDFATQVDDLVALKAQGKTSVALDDLKRNLPEYKNYIEAVATEARTRRPGFGQNMIERAQTASPEAANLRGAQTALQAATNQVDEAVGAYSPFKRVTPQNSENFIRTLMSDRGRKIELKKVAVSLGELSDENFVQMIDDLRVREGFEKGFQNGSSNVNLWGTLAGVFGLVSGDPTLGIASGGAGVAFGKIMDAYGPKITRRVLDGMVFMRGIPTVQKINQVFGDIPEQLRTQLRTDLIRAINIGNQTPLVTVPQEERANVAKDIFDSPNLNSIEKANAIDDVNRRGAVDSKLMQKVMIGEETAPEEQQVIQRPKARSIEQITDFVNNKKVEQY